MMEPTDALRSIETVLRIVIRDVIGEPEWLSMAGAPDQEALQARRDEEAKRRDGAVVSSELLDYAETYHLTGLVAKNWEQFHPIFKDKQRTLGYFGVIEDVRNSIAHSRSLVPFERELISGIAGQLRNQVSLYRSSKDESTRYYPLIESIRDNFGRDGIREDDLGGQVKIRVDVGDTLTFTASAINARGRPVGWYLLVGRYPSDAPSVVAMGDTVTFDYTVSESDVGESFQLLVRISAESRYHRYTFAGEAPYDDAREFFYAVNPPAE